MQTKTCNVCRADKPATEYHRRAASADGLCYTCKTCAKARAWLAYAADTETANAERKKRYENRRESELESRRQWRARTVEYRRVYFNAYREWRGKQTPLWADLAEIRKVYAEADRRRARGERVHVDHIIPLRGKRVSGLHVVHNLRIIPANENSAKSNKFLPELLAALELA